MMKLMMIKMVYIFKNKKTKLRNWNQLILKRRRTHFLMYARSKIKRVGVG